MNTNKKIALFFMKYIMFKTLRQKKRLRTLIWWTIDGFLSGVWVVLAWLEWWEAVLVATVWGLLLERITKFVNVNLFNDWGVKKDV